MASKYGEYVWHNGEYIAWNDANIHVMSHVIHYGTSVFEGIRAYDTHKGAAVFRLREHIRRLLDSAKIYRMQPDYTVDQLIEASLETIRKNKMNACYIRPVIFRGYGEFGVNPFNNPIESYVAVWEWGKYLGAEALEQGVDVCTSSWNRIAPNTLPALAKTGANYMNSQLIKMEAIQNGYVEGIALERNGYVSEGSGENLFLVRDGVMRTPNLASSVLPGITRNTIIHLARNMGIEVIEETIPRESLYIADEVFFTGTAAEITPIRSIDKIEIGSGRRGEITKKLQDAFFNIFTGETDIPQEWLTPIY